MTRTRASAIAGVGYTKFTRTSGKSVLALAAEACADAMVDAGMTVADIDGIATYSLYSDSPPSEAVAATLGIRDLTWCMDVAQGGQAPSYMVLMASLAVESGLADNVIIFRAMNGRSGTRIGPTLAQGGSSSHRYPHGYVAYPQYTAMMFRRYMIETGATQEDLAAVAVAQRRYAIDNERARMRTPLTYDDYFAAPYVADPFRIPDCTVEVDGACAVLVTSVERARSCPQPPVLVAGGAWATHGFGQDMGDTFSYDDYSRNYTHHLSRVFWPRVGLVPGDVDVAELYDCFTGVLLMNMEGMGFCERGAAGSFHRTGETSLTGKLPTNTHGGLLSEGYLHGMNSVCEAVSQLRGAAGARQVADPEVAVTCSGGMTSGSALALTVDR